MQKRSPKFLDRKRSQSGQGLVEYVLLLVVVVGIITGAIYQLNNSVRVWADNYFGDYLACLLETGELPSVGGGSTSGECNQLYQDFDFANGRSAKDPTVSPGTTDTEQSEKDDDDPGKGPSAAAGGNVGRSALIPAGSSSRRRSLAKRFSARGSGGGMGSGSAESNEEGTDTGSTAVANVEGYQTGRTVRMPVREAPSLAGGRRVKEKKKDGQGRAAVAVKKSEVETEKRDQLIKVERKTASADEGPDIEEFSLGNWLRYLIIILIIIAILVVVGGELLQASKNMD